MNLLARTSFAAICLSASFAFGSTLTGKVVAIHDGDSLTVLDADKTQHKVRLSGIDAPEQRQAFGTRSKQALGEKLHEQSVRVEYESFDQFGRIIGVVFVGDRNINREMVADGFAWHFLKYSKSTELADAEKSARDSKAGLWADSNAVPPWDFRRSHDIAETALEKPLDTTKVYVTETGEKYHRAGCRHLAGSAKALPLDEAKKNYQPCRVCRPPL